MLILSRKIGESIVIDDRITVTLLEQRGGQIRVGIDAPKNIKVYRQELYQQVQKDNQEASNLPNDLLEQIAKKFPDLKKND